MPDLGALGEFVIKVGIEPAIIAGLGFFLYKVVTDGHDTQDKLTCAVNDLSGAVDKLTEFVKGSRA